MFGLKGGGDGGSTFFGFGNGLQRLRQALVGGVSLYPASGSGSGLGSSLALSELFAFFPFQHLCPPFSSGAQQFTEA